MTELPSKKHLVTYPLACTWYNIENTTAAVVAKSFLIIFTLAIPSNQNNIFAILWLSMQSNQKAKIQFYLIVQNHNFEKENRSS